MADNVPITAGVGTDVATDDISSVHYQIVKIGVGAANAIDGHLDFGQAAMAASLPVALASDQTALPITDNSGSLTVDGTVTANPSTISALHVVAASSDNAQSVKAAAGTLRGISFYNNAAVPIYVKFHNTAGVPTAGAGVVRTFGIQAGTQVNFVIPGGGVAFATGIGLTIVKALADNGTTATTAADAVGEIWYE